MLRAPLTFYSAWFSPSVQRVWIALNHGDVPFRMVQGLVLDHEDPAKSKGYEKHPGLLAANPKGLVPTLVLEGKQPVYESLICMEYVSDLSANGRSLLPECPTDRAHARLHVDWLNRNICSPFYRVLVPKDIWERRKAFETMQTNIEVMEGMIKGPFFFGRDMSIADVAVFPWMYRVIDAKIIEKFRSWSIQVPPNVQTWYNTMLAEPAVRDTLVDAIRVRQAYQRYADATAMSAVAEALRQGKNAHDIE